MVEPRGALCLLCGLPAAGKSSLAQHLLDVGPSRLQAALGVPGVRVWHVCFDAMMAALEVEAGASSFDPELWHASRRRALEAVRSHFCGGDAAVDGAALRTIGGVMHNSSGDDTSTACLDVLVLDDNMHYRSMRRAYFRVAREARLSYCTLSLPVALEDAVNRDANRPASQRVGRVTIEQMAETLQVLPRAT